MQTTNGRGASGGRLAGKVAVISGSARGLGAAMARLFTGEGASVLVTDILDELGEETAAAIREAGGRAVYQHLDVTQVDDWAAAVERATAEFGVPDVLVSNAYYFALPPIMGEDPETWARSLDVNLTGHYHGFRAVLPGMIELGRGSIIAIASTNGGDVAFPSQASYQAAKAGVIALTRHVAAVHGADGIRANTIHPGPMRTAAIQSAPGFEEAVEQIATSFPIGRVPEPEEVAWGAVYLASDESSYMTGAKMVIDGGSTAALLVAKAALEGAMEIEAAAH
jgi:NAD(P)-dependent dehydrogenase (short-subunit alcohol dehydrogenase family)